MIAERWPRLWEGARRRQQTKCRSWEDRGSSRQSRVRWPKRDRQRTGKDSTRNTDEQVTDLKKMCACKHTLSEHQTGLYWFAWLPPRGTHDEGSCQENEQVGMLGNNDRFLDLCIKQCKKKLWYVQYNHLIDCYFREWQVYSTCLPQGLEPHVRDQLNTENIGRLWRSG